ncbi:vascular cell adhesion protein 1 isoform X1 [Anguilla anguilla]|uniref:vascular cell adhesion protein 1 isoform X1 n=1 Tax=Anguilla anguilla TaxID=7936 RepID=UPI0015B2B723|nr:vascular cell adhesion protein 1 isoform X1 [Anguilla anguilla]
MALWMLWIFVLPAAFSLDSLEPKYSTSQLGDRLVLKCSTRRCEKPSFTWRALDDQPLMHTSETNPSPTESQLVFHPVTLTRKTTIECGVFCGGKKFFRKAQVNVYSFPADPEVSGYDHLRHGEKSNLTCVVRDIYTADLLKVEWVQGETVLSTTEHEMSADDAVETHTSVYSYIPDFGDGKKNITCRATLDLDGVPVNQQTRQTTVNLTVQTPPRNTTVTVSPSWQVQEGQNVTISCRTVSSPSPRYVLKKDGSDVEMESQDGTFRLQQVQLRDAGLYQLTVSNRLGSSTERLTLNVTGPPQNTTVTVSPSWQVQEGQDVTISCRTVSSPPPRYVLKKDGSDEGMESQDGTFRLRQVQLRDAGLYQLTVSNQLGSSTERLTLNVTAPPRNTTVTVSPSWQVQEGQNVTISCRTVSSPPPRYILKKDGSDVEMESQDGTFWLQQVQLRDAGLYQLNVSNRLGSSTERLTLSVTAPPRNTTVTVSPSWQVQEAQDVTISYRTVRSPNSSFPSVPLPVQDPPPKDHIILLAVIGPTVAVVTIAALVTHHLWKAKTRGVYELGKDVLLPV